MPTHRVTPDCELHCVVDDFTDALPKTRCPTLVITTEGSGLAAVEETRAWQRRIPRSELLVLPGDSYHVAASDAGRCARETLAFITRVSWPGAQVAFH